MHDLNICGLDSKIAVLTQVRCQSILAQEPVQFARPGTNVFCTFHVQNSQLRTRADKGAILFKLVLLNETCSCGVPLPVKLVEWKEFISVKLGAETWSLFLWKSGSRKLWVFLSVKLRVVVFELVSMNAMCCCGVLFHGGSLDFPC